MTIYTDFIKKHHDYNKLNNLFKLSVTNQSNEINIPDTSSDDSLSGEDSLNKDIDIYESNLIFDKDDTSICNQAPKCANAYDDLIGWTTPDDLLPNNYQPLCEETKDVNVLNSPQNNNSLVFNLNETFPLDLTSELACQNDSLTTFTTSILSSDDECKCLYDIKKPSDSKKVNSSSWASKKAAKRTTKSTRTRSVQNRGKGKEDSLQQLLHSIRNDTNDLLSCPLTNSPINIAPIEGKSKRRNSRANKKCLPNLDLGMSHIEDDLNNDEIICEAIPSIRFMVRFMGNNNKVYPLEIKNNERMEKLLEAICALEPCYSPQDLKLQRRDQDIILFQTPETLKLAPGTFLECLEIPGRLSASPQASTSATYFPSDQSSSVELSGQVETFESTQLLKLKVQYLPSNKESTETVSGLNKAAKVPRAAVEYEKSMGRGQKLSKLVEAFSAYAGLNPKKLKLSFDGSILDLDSEIGDTELEDGDVLDAVST